MKKEYITPKSKAVELSQDICINTTSNFADDQRAGCRKDRNDWDEEDW